MFSYHTRIRAHTRMYVRARIHARYILIGGCYFFFNNILTMGLIAVSKYVCTFTMSTERRGLEDNSC